MYHVYVAFYSHTFLLCNLISVRIKMECNRHSGACVFFLKYMKEQ